MASVEWDIEIEQGDTWTSTVTYADSLGAAINLTGYTAKLFILDKYGPGATVYHTFDSAVVNGGITITALTGTLLLAISAAISDAFPFDVAVHRLRITSPSGVKTTLAKGKIRVIA